MNRFFLVAGLICVSSCGSPTSAPSEPAVAAPAVAAPAVAAPAVAAPAVEAPAVAAPAVEAPAVAAPAPTPLTAAGDATTLPPLTLNDDLNGAASVVRVDELTREENAGVKLFGSAGGDPAMNGLHSYIAFYAMPDEGWRVFELGDFLEYRIVNEAAGRVDLELRESVMDEATAEITTQTRHVIVSWTRDDEAPPTSITVTPAAAPRQ